MSKTNGKKTKRVARARKLSHRAKLTAAQVRQLRNLHAKGWSFSQLAEKFDVAVPTAWRAVRGVTYQSVT